MFKFFLFFDYPKKGGSRINDANRYIPHITSTIGIIPNRMLIIFFSDIALIYHLIKTINNNKRTIAIKVIIANPIIHRSK
ncbi:MAG: hypothetical protein D3906_02790 [Candidatus Electrothrix sp. AUS1_2]|nr:hypothetical protein [Candidatus Electrothrix sp. AUS1_2]